MVKQKIRGLISLGLLIFWAVSALSGFILYLAPEGQRSGRAVILFNLTKHGWSEIHAWVSFIALGITLAHIFVDWHMLIAVLKLLSRGNVKQ